MDAIFFTNQLRSDEPIEMLSGEADSRGARKHVLDGSPDPPGEGQYYGEHVPNITRKMDTHFLRPTDATKSTQQGRHGAAMRAVVTITVATCFTKNAAI